MKASDRFSHRAEDYALYRPSYPQEIMPFLEEHGIIKPSVVADIGAGTGIFTSILLERGYIVYAIEPNDEMRRYAHEKFKNENNFHERAGSSEETGLRDKSIDGIFMAQAFHWIDAEKSRIEFLRILKQNGPVVILWNDRDDSTGFGKDLEQVIKKHSIDYYQVSRRVKSSRAIIARFFGHEPEYAAFYYAQTLSESALLGRLTSCSYLPHAMHPQFLAMKDDVAQLFARYQRNNEVVLPYITRVYWGHF